MALLSILTGSQPKRTKFMNVQGIDLMVVDATLSFAPEYMADVTEHPVEDGPDVADHIRVKNIKLKMEGIASETPISLGSSLAGLATSLGSAAGGAIAGKLGSAIGAAAAGIGASILRTSPTPDQEMRSFLIGLLESRKTFVLWTPERKYDSLVMTSVTFPKDQKTGRALKFSCSMQRIQIVTAQFVRLDNVDPSVFHTGTKKAKLGSQATKPTNDQTSKGSSVLFASAQSVGAVK